MMNARQMNICAGAPYTPHGDCNAKHAISPSWILPAHLTPLTGTATYRQCDDPTNILGRTLHPSRGLQLHRLRVMNHQNHLGAPYTPHGDCNSGMLSKTFLPYNGAPYTPHGDCNVSNLLQEKTRCFGAPYTPHGDCNPTAPVPRATLPRRTLHPSRGLQHHEDGAHTAANRRTLHPSRGLQLKNLEVFGFLVDMGAPYTPHGDCNHSIGITPQTGCGAPYTPHGDCNSFGVGLDLDHLGAPYTPHGDCNSFGVGLDLDHLGAPYTPHGDCNIIAILQDDIDIRRTLHPSRGLCAPPQTPGTKNGLPVFRQTICCVY